MSLNARPGPQRFANQENTGSRMMRNEPFTHRRLRFTSLLLENLRYYIVKLQKYCVSISYTRLSFS